MAREKVLHVEEERMPCSLCYNVCNEPESTRISFIDFSTIWGCTIYLIAH